MTEIRQSGLGIAGRFSRAGWVLLMVMATLSVPAPAAAQQHKDWDVTIAPLYFWAPAIDGSMTVGPKTVPIYVPFSDAKSKLAGAFSFHFEGRKDRVGVESDVNFVRLSTDTTYHLPNGQAVQGTLALDTTIFEVAGTYLAARDFTIIGGIRTYTIAPTITLTGPNQANSVDVSKTQVDGFGGFMFRPQLGKKVELISRADIGGGASKLTWRATLGVEYRYRPWGGLAIAYSALGINTGDNTASTPAGSAIVTNAKVTEYGPAFSLTFHWGQ